MCIPVGEPKGLEQKDGERFGFNNMCYKESEVRRIAKVAFDIALKRGSKVCSVDKANVLDVSQLWRDVVIETHKENPEYSKVELSHMYVDNAAMQLIRNPKQFDVMVTGNIFGDILSDEASKTCRSSITFNDQICTIILGLNPDSILDTILAYRFQKSCKLWVSTNRCF